MTDETPVNPEKEEREAIARIGTTPDGLLLHRYLRRVLESRRGVGDYGALSRHEGARILAGDVMAIMAEGIEQNRGRSESDRTILAGTSRPVAVARTGTRRRGADAPGWGPEPEPSASGRARKRRAS